MERLAIYYITGNEECVRVWSLENSDFSIIVLFISVV